MKIEIEEIIAMTIDEELSRLIDERLNSPESYEAYANLRGVGLRLHAKGGMELMRSSMEAAAGDGPDYERRVNACDKAWHGIGEWLS
jgi:hypothetical protein